MRVHSQLFLTPIILAGSLLAQPAAPEIAYDSAPGLLRLPEHIHMGEAAGVATNSKGNVFVYTRTGGANATLGGSRTFTHGGSRLFEFDHTGKFVREVGQGVYGFVFAQAVRVDSKDNIWVVDRGSNMVIKFDREGRVVMTLSRKPESVSPAPAEGAEVAEEVEAEPPQAPEYPATTSTVRPTSRGTWPGISL